MNLTRYADYSLRVLIFVALREERLSTVPEISAAYGISRNHLVKVVHQLGRLGYLDTVRGRNGGLRLGKPPQEIRLSAVIRDCEPSFDLLECFNAATDRCAITPVCGLKNVLGEAMAAFFAVLERYTLADVLRNRRALAALLDPGAPPRDPTSGVPGRP